MLQSEHSFLEINMNTLFCFDLPKRNKPFFHTSWLAKYLSGNSTCGLALYTLANFKVPSESSPELLQYNVIHRKAVAKVEQEYRSKGYEVFVEDANQFWINTTIGASLSGTPDLVALSSQESKIIEVKTGQLSEESQLKDQAQLEIYMSCAPKVGLHGMKSIPQGELIYFNGDTEIQRISIPPDQVNHQSWREAVTNITKIATTTSTPEPKPSAKECAFCRIRLMCPAAFKIPSGEADF